MHSDAEALNRAIRKMLQNKIVNSTSGATGYHLQEALNAMDVPTKLNLGPFLDQIDEACRVLGEHQAKGDRGCEKMLNRIRKSLADEETHDWLRNL